MVNYGNGKIYKIINENNEIIYIGSTAQKLCESYSYHTHKASNHRIILIENYSCNNREELRKREQEVIEENTNLLNQIRAYVTEEEKKEWHKQHNQKRKNNPEYIKKKKEYDKEYREKNKEEISAKRKEYRENNKDIINQKVKCKYCNTELNKRNLKRHITKNKKCLAIQEQINN